MDLIVIHCTTLRNQNVASFVKIVDVIGVTGSQRGDMGLFYYRGKNVDLVGWVPVTISCRWGGCARKRLHGAGYIERRQSLPSTASADDGTSN